MKKILLVIAFVALFTLAPTVKANVVEVDDGAKFKEEIEKGGEVKLTKNIDDLSSIIEINNDVIIDLGKNTVTSTAERVFNIRKGTVTIKNGTIKDEAANGHSIIYVYGAQTPDTDKVNLTLADDLTLEGISGLTVSHNNGNNYGTVINVNCNMKVTVSSNPYELSALAVHGDLKTGDVVVNVTGNLTGKNAGIYQAGASTINLNKGAVVTGASGVVTKSGTLNVNGATILGTGELQSPTSANDGYVPTGAGIQIESNNGYGAVNVNVDGGKISSKSNSAIEEYLATDTDATKVEKIVVKGNATLTSASDKEVIAGSVSFDGTQKGFIEKGTVLSGKTDSMSGYLETGLEINDSGKVIDPNEPIDTPSKKPSASKQDDVPKTGMLFGINYVKYLVR